VARDGHGEGWPARDPGQRTAPRDRGRGTWSRVFAEVDDQVAGLLCGW